MSNSSQIRQGSFQTPKYRCVDVDLGKNSYPIRIGEDLLESAGEMISDILPNSNCAIVSDENVANLYLNELKKSLDKRNIKSIDVIVPPGEPSKSFATFQMVANQILDARFERNDVVIGLGGGVVGDLAGFVASTIRRGMNFVQIPTSLLAQVDSSVGGKTGINSSQGKNLIGAFLQPKLVIADTGLLKSLSAREFRAGYAEVAKYGLIDRPDFFEQLEKNWQDIFSFGDQLIDAIAISCSVKAEIVSLDEFEHGRRALLNLGHTFGHALEAATGYDSTRLVHGEGVAIGTVLAYEFSNKMNICDADSVARVKRHFSEVGLPISIAEIPGHMPGPKQLLGYISQDKKVTKGELTFILTKGVGKSYIANNVIASEVQSFLEEKL
ncbi:MAG: 3-dehydroquinate synthase [Hyphomicrobiales bacterium]|nr:3-dehydroquinate synthase [Hyphomicrobiales bacterium]